MAYVESHYLELNAEPNFIDNVDAQQVENIQPLVDDSQKAMPKSDYCGFEGDDIPPVYRAQLRAAQKTKLSTSEPKSSYIYGKDEKEKAMSEEKIAPNDAQSVEYYVPGFSPPPQNDGEEVQKRLDFSLPKIQAVEATEHVFDIKGKHEASQYVLMENEDPMKVNKKTEMESEISYTSSDVTSSIATSSCLTASLGPAYGEINSGRFSNDKYKGLSAFQPVTNGVQSQYVSEELN
ncbi:hypothetical protein CRE_16229 [Caenorhabditis remanei]|uniref:Uncharacterized protein n=1 Tax=Caenorhabditis remanei TaxID=31234 RepID=E3MSP1_CAERE|nr:hypothetical protein CRE_16229 [Caenorhabditis remanei]